MEFGEGGSELTFSFRVRGVYFGVKGLESFPLEARADEVPVQYTPDEWTDLSGHLRPHARIAVTSRRRCRALRGSLVSAERPRERALDDNSA